MTIITSMIEYQHEGAKLNAYIAWDDQFLSARPGVLVCHDAMGGGTAFEFGRAEALAKLGYVGFAVDVYGDKKRASNGEEAYRLMKPFVSDRAFLRARLAAAKQQLSSLAVVDENNLAVIGYCFGGLCALEMARAGMPIKAAASFHGSLASSEDLLSQPIKANILVMHGWRDPIVPVDEVMNFAAEMTAAQADWQLLAYGEAMHSFTNPLANAPASGVLYDAVIDKRSWQALDYFLAESFSTQV